MFLAHFCRPADGEGYLQVNLPKPLHVQENSGRNWAAGDGCNGPCEACGEENLMNAIDVLSEFILFILGFYIAFNTVLVIS